ncbi:ABC transporter substrate-binding protein [Bifidobacterium avesanii]|uniref:Extracellular solute-binding protein n=1 Tax=Bifidobacterium avesanii TaxID=1798157 RepID=A0A7K3TFU6_9BIFI|nr:ABC transporter substrate-binding protein [Bifidobacterium avesanii]KAB8291445.1 ABC transporter substrate-binding protein [Bifidobacterium avesanii]NEG77922.1 extracellular solute-binding protein [Bifidobacterium avesanii]
MKQFTQAKALAAVAALAMALAGCGAGSSDNADEAPVTTIDKDVEITFWHAMTGAQQTTLQQLTDAFMKANPKIKVTLQNQSSYGDLQQKLTATMQSPKNLPTITQAYPGWLSQGFEDGTVVALDDYIKSSDKNLAFDDWDDVLSGLRDGVTFNGKIYGMPFNKSTEVLWYNKTLFDKLGIQVPKTYDELVAASQKIKQSENIPGLGFDSLSNFYITYLKNNGTEFDKSLDVSGAQSQAAFDWYGKGVADGTMRIAGTDKYMSGPFGSQKVGMYIGSNAGESFVKQGAAGKFEYGVAPYPAKYSLQQGTDIYMFDSATPEQRTAAFMYEKFLTSKDSQITWAVNTGYMPVRSSAIKDDKYTKSGSSIAPILADATKNLFTAPLSAGSQQAVDDTDSALEGYLANPSQNLTDVLSRYKATFDSDVKQ